MIRPVFCCLPSMHYYQLLKITWKLILNVEIKCQFTILINKFSELYWMTFHKHPYTSLLWCLEARDVYRENIMVSIEPQLQNTKSWFGSYLLFKINLVWLWWYVKVLDGQEACPVAYRVWYRYGGTGRAWLLFETDPFSRGGGGLGSHVM